MLDQIQAVSRSHPVRRAELQSTRARLIRVGLQKVLESGWAATGIDAVLRECDVPKGSFYHYFASKEAFGYALLDSYQAFFMQRLSKWFVDSPIDNLAQMQTALNGFLADSVVGMQRHKYLRGCLVGALGQEVASLHEGFRAKLLASLEEWEKILSNALFNSMSSYKKQSQLSGKNIETTSLLRSQCDAWAREFWVAWEGAVLRSLLARNPEALQTVVRQFGHQLEAWAELEQGRKPKPASAANTKKIKKPNKIKEIQSHLNF
jgi:TetR/AcrR family transcriptional regulator, transcriptional repressor for nem operon